VHHAIVVALDPSNRAHEEYLGGYSPGMTPQMWKPGQARLVKAGSTLVFQMHYSANGKPARDRTRIGLIFARAPVTEQIAGIQVMPSGLNIPPDAADYRVEASDIIHQNIKLVGMRPHMHLRGKSFEFRAVYPDGETETLLRVPKFDFNWQPYYYLKPQDSSRGTRIECTAYFDNSANNPFNPDPTTRVFGDRRLGRDDDRMDGRRGRPPEASASAHLERCRQSRPDSSARLPP
jgi:hypothetical protein